MKPHVCAYTNRQEEVGEMWPRSNKIYLWYAYSHFSRKLINPHTVYGSSK
jgi:hypothetical protein